MYVCMYICATHISYILVAAFSGSMCFFRASSQRAMSTMVLSFLSLLLLSSDVVLAGNQTAGDAEGEKKHRTGNLMICTVIFAVYGFLHLCYIFKGALLKVARLLVMKLFVIVLHLMELTKEAEGNPAMPEAAQATQDYTIAKLRCNSEQLVLFISLMSTFVITDGKHKNRNFKDISESDDGADYARYALNQAGGISYSYKLYGIYHKMKGEVTQGMRLAIDAAEENI